MSAIQNFFNISGYLILARIVVILLILPLHEFAHGWMARRFGDDTALASGRLTLNPFAHIDPIGAILLLLTGFGWAKPVPINPARMRNPRSGIIWTSLAGPFSNLLAAIVGMILSQVTLPFFYVYGGEVLQMVYLFLRGFVSVNICLALFNLIPIPPLDGSKVLMALLPYRQSMWMQMHQQMLSLILLLLVVLRAISIPLGWASGQLETLLFRGTYWIVDLLLPLVIT